MAVAPRIYAKALFDAAKDAGRLPQAREELGDLVAALETSPDLRNLLHNPQIDARAKKAGLDAIFADADAVFRNFLRTVADKGRLREIEAIQGELERLVADEERVLAVELTTAVELSDAEAAGIVGQIERACGRRVEASRSVDPTLIGGILLQAGSFRVDGSVRGRLDSLRQELITK
ncbi:MAG: ATP synthase F1 subunit delta [Thermoleophilia bacterium]|nr:ATP synthase F1 subunit delta [Thermoleophilia bacterium]